MLCIRLQRTGNRNNPAFRLVAADKRNSAKKNPLEILGHYLPTRDPAVFEFDKQRVEHFLRNGAEPSDTVARLLSKGGVKGLEKYMKRYSKKKKKNAPDEPETPPAPAPEAATDAPAEEVAPVEEAPKEEEKPAQEPEKEEAPAEEPKEEAPTEEDKPAEEAAPEEGDDKKDA